MVLVDKVSEGMRSSGRSKWRRSVVKPERGQGQSGQAIKLEADPNSLSFSAPKMGYLVIFGFFIFGRK